MQGQGGVSKTVYVRGIAKIVTRDDIQAHFSTVGKIDHINFSESPRQGYCWVTYTEEEHAHAAVLTLHHSKLGNVIISVRYEFGRKSDGRFVSQPSPALRRSIESTSNSVAYTSRGLMVNNSLYPIPTGQYLLQLLQLRHNNSDNALLPYFNLLLSQPNSTKQTKELTEVMAMVNAIKTLIHRGSVNLLSHHYTIYVVADGQTPLTAAAIALHYPSINSIYSIDPLLVNYSGSLDRITVIPCMSQEFKIPLITTDTTNIIVACHSHAPLQEFWDRVQSPKIAITMPCCSKTYSALNIVPIDVYDDFEVYSPKRKVYLYENM